MSREIVFLTGSPSTSSKSAVVAQTVAGELQATGFYPRFWSVRDFEPGDVLHGRSDAPAIVRFIDAARSATGVVLVSPVYKATYTGALKAVVDLIPPDALVDQPMLAIATARLAAHGAAADQAFRSLFAFFRARPVDVLALLDEELQGSEGGLAAERRLRRAAKALADAADEKGPRTDR